MKVFFQQVLALCVIATAMVFTTTAHAAEPTWAMLNFGVRNITEDDAATFRDLLQTEISKQREVQFVRSNAVCGDKRCAAAEGNKLGAEATVYGSIAALGEKLIWAPDRFLGDYVQKATGADMLLWQGSCVVHERFKAEGIRALKLEYPEAAVLVHPESPSAVIALADVVGSTTQLIRAAAALPNSVLIVATDNGIFHKMHEAAPGKRLIEAPTGGTGATCVSCAHCPWMAMNGLKNLLALLETGNNEIQVAEAIRVRAVRSINRMLEFAGQSGIAVAGRSAD